MKSFLLIVLMAFSFGAFAQYQSPDKMLYLEKYNKFRSMRNAGVAMTIVGAIVAVVGFSEATNTTTTTYNNGGYNYNSTSTSLSGAEIVATLGIGLMGGGITLWAIGGKKMKTYQSKADGVSLNLKMAPQQAGLAFSYKF